jgi:hypothetical protein
VAGSQAAARDGTEERVRQRCRAGSRRLSDQVACANRDWHKLRVSYPFPIRARTWYLTGQSVWPETQWWRTTGESQVVRILGMSPVSAAGNSTGAVVWRSDLTSEAGIRGAWRRDLAETCAMRENVKLSKPKDKGKV